MIRSPFLRRMLSLTVCAVLLTALFTAAIFYLMVQNIVLRETADELKPDADMVADWTLQVRGGHMPYSIYNSLILSNFRDASVHIYDGEKNLLLYTTLTKEDEKIQRTYLELHAQLMDQVLSGEDVRKGRFYSHSGYLIVGVPVTEGGRVVGAVFMTTSMQELSGLSSTLYSVLIGSACLALLSMFLPIYFFFRRSVEPINQMRNVAMVMAAGDFQTRADTRQQGELGDLAKALNHLSYQLGTSISELQLERNRLRSIVNGIEEGIVAVDPQGTVSYVSPSVAELFRCDVCNTPQTDLLDALHLRATFNDAIETGTAAPYHGQFGDVSVQGNIAPLHDENGNFAGAVGLFRDVTEEERLERVRREYVANVSHELRTPIASVRSLSETLNDGLLKTEEDKKRYYGYLLRESMRLGRLVDDLLELSRLQSGHVALERRKTDIRELVRELGERYRGIADEVGINFRVDDPEGCPPADTNADRVEQILLILLDNAIKFTPLEGEVRIQARWDDDFVYLTVTDTGVGVSEGDQKHIFERFYKADKAHSGQGTGLGLSIAQEIVTQLGGSIWVQSRPGEGAAFTFCVPLWGIAPASEPGSGGPFAD